MTREEMQGFFLNVLVGLVSVAIAALGGVGATSGQVGLPAGLPSANDQRPRYGLPQRKESSSALRPEEKTRTAKKRRAPERPGV